MCIFRGFNRPKKAFTNVRPFEANFTSVWVILVPFKCMSALTQLKAVPLISMQVTWLQILNFTCKCGANDLNSIWIWITQHGSPFTAAKSSSRCETEVISRTCSIYFRGKGEAAELNSSHQSSEGIRLISIFQVNKHNHLTHLLIIRPHPPQHHKMLLEEGDESLLQKHVSQSGLTLWTRTSNT